MTKERKRQYYVNKVMAQRPVRLKLKGCPRCGGDIGVDKDQHGWYESCIQCGYLKDLVIVGMGQVRDEIPVGKKYRKRDYPRRVVV